MKHSLITAFSLAALLLSTSIYGCSKTTSSETSDINTTDSSITSNNVNISNSADNSVDPAVSVNLNDEVSDKMYNRAMLNEGNLARLANAMKKAKNGESVTVSVIGGSITQGSSASSTANSYAAKFNDWWTMKFPDSEIKYVNAGIGGTDSYLGVHRVDEQLLSHNPDVVIVEFSVNDVDKVMNKYSYDSLVRKILKSESAPAVILLFTTMENGTSMQDTHKEIGTAYNLPMISYREAVYPEVAAGTLNWADISPDDIHPNDAGHNIINQLLSRYLNDVYNKLDSITESSSEFTEEAPTRDYYENAALYSASKIEPASMDNFTVGNNKLYSQFTDNWIAESGGSLIFDVECRNFGVFFLRTIDGKSGTYEVYVDGERKGKLEADFTGGWGNYGFTKQIIIGNDILKHTVEIKPAEGSEDKAITILALMIS